MLKIRTACVLAVFVVACGGGDHAGNPSDGAALDSTLSSDGSPDGTSPGDEGGSSEDAAGASSEDAGASSDDTGASSDDTGTPIDDASDDVTVEDASSGDAGFDATVDASSGDASVDGAPPIKDASGVDDAHAQDAAPDADSGGPFTVSSLPGLALWLDAAKGVTRTGSNVSLWADQSGHGNDATGGGATPPFYALGVHGLPTINNQYGGGGEGSMAIGVAPRIGSSEVLIEIVGAMTVAPCGICRLLTADYMWIDMLGPTGLAPSVTLSLVTTTTINGTSIGTDPRLIGFRRTGSGATAKIELRANGAVDTSAMDPTYGYDLGGVNGLLIGGRGVGAYEIIVVIGPTSDANLANLETYLKNKYGL